MNELLIVAIVVSTLVLPAAAWQVWSHRRLLLQLLADIALFPFVAAGWLIGAALSAIEFAYYAIMTGYERGRGRSK